MREGALLYVEEINRIPEETLNVLITVMSERELHVPRFVFISALKADEGAATVPQLAAKLAAERALQASGMEYAIIRPS